MSANDNFFVDPYRNGQPQQQSWFYMPPIGATSSQSYLPQQQQAKMTTITPLGGANINSQCFPPPLPTYTTTSQHDLIISSNNNDINNPSVYRSHNKLAIDSPGPIVSRMLPREDTTIVLGSNTAPDASTMVASTSAIQIHSMNSTIATVPNNQTCFYNLDYVNIDHPTSTPSPPAMVLSPEMDNGINIKTKPGTDHENPFGKRRIATKACISCRKAHACCGNERPCKRCQFYEIDCIDVAARKRGPKKGSTRKPKKSTKQQEQQQDQEKQQEKQRKPRQPQEEHHDRTPTTASPESTTPTTHGASALVKDKDQCEVIDLSTDDATWMPQQQQQQQWEQRGQALVVPHHHQHHRALAHPYRPWSDSDSSSSSSDEGTSSNNNHLDSLAHLIEQNIRRISVSDLMRSYKVSRSKMGVFVVMLTDKPYIISMNSTLRDLVGRPIFLIHDLVHESQLDVSHSLVEAASSQNIDVQRGRFLCYDKDRNLVEFAFETAIYRDQNKLNKFGVHPILFGVSRLYFLD